MGHGTDAPPSHSKGGHHAQREHPPRTRDVPYMPGTDGRYRPARRWRTLYSEFASTLDNDPEMKERLRGVAVSLDPLRLLDEIRSMQRYLAALAAGSAVGIPPGRDADLEKFLASLSTCASSISVEQRDR